MVLFGLPPWPFGGRKGRPRGDLDCWRNSARGRASSESHDPQVYPRETPTRLRKPTRDGAGARNAKAGYHRSGATPGKTRMKKLAPRLGVGRAPQGRTHTAATGGRKRPLMNQVSVSATLLFCELSRAGWLVGGHGVLREPQSCTETWSTCVRTHSHTHAHTHTHTHTHHTLTGHKLRTRRTTQRMQASVSQRGQRLTIITARRYH